MGLKAPIRTSPFFEVHVYMSKLLSPLLVCIAFLLCSCASEHHKSNVSLNEFKKHVQEDKTQNTSKRGIWDYAIPATEDGDYRLQTGDLVSISVFGIEELQATVRINSRGKVSFPLLNQISLKGLTATAAEERIEALLKEDYMYDPHVTVIIDEMVGQQVTMVGAVNHPGTFEIKSKKTILDILALAEGLDKNASDVAYVTRKDIDGKNNNVFLVDLHQLINKGKVDMNMPVKGGDVIFIPEAGVVSIDGAVRKPGTVYLEGEMTINEAIAAAGGLQEYADLDDIKLIRVLESGRRQVVQLALDEIQGNTGRELLLREDDIVYVEASGYKVFTSGFTFNLGFLGTGVKYDSPVD